MRRWLKLIILFCTLGCISCKKDTGKKYCWQTLDNLGNRLTEVCDKTEAELLECMHNGSCGGFTSGSVITNCNYFKIDGDKFCWLIKGTVYKDLTENEALLYSRCYLGGAPPSIANCDLACQNWYHREKRTFKPDNTYQYSPVTLEYFCGDTVRSLYQGRQITRKDDTDSLIVIQFSSDGNTW